MAQPELFEKNRLAAIILSQPVGTPKASFQSASLSLAPGGVGGVAPALQLSFNMQTQAQDQWCWAATTVSVSVFYSQSSTWTQCSLVCAELGDSSCCVDGSTPNCDLPWTLDTALQRTNNLFNWVAGPLLGTEIQAQLSSGRPICCRIGWSNGGGHFVAITGYQSNGNGDEVTVDDPFYHRSYLSLSVFENSYQNSGTWTHSYYTQP